MKTNTLVLVSQNLLPKNLDDYQNELDFWLNQAYANDSIRMSVHEYFILINLMRATLTSTLYKGYYLVDFDLLVESRLKGEIFNNETLGIHDIRARIYDNSEHQGKRKTKPRVRSTKMAKYNHNYTKKQIASLVEKQFLDKKVSLELYKSTQAFTLEQGMQTYKSIFILSKPHFDCTTLMTTERKIIRPVQFNLDIESKNLTDVFFDVFSQNFAPTEDVGKARGEIENVYQIKINNKIASVKLSSHKLDVKSKDELKEGEVQKYSSQCLGRDKLAASKIQQAFFEIDAKEICKGNWDYKDYNNEYELNYNLLGRFMGLSAGSNVYNQIQQTVTRLTTVTHILSVDPKDIDVMSALAFVPQDGKPKDTVQFTYLVHKGERSQEDFEYNTTSNTGSFFLGWNSFDEQLYRKKLKSLYIRQQKLIQEWESKGCVGKKPILDKNTVLDFLQGFQNSRYQNQEIRMLPNKLLDVAESFISALIKNNRGAGYWTGVDHSQELTSNHRKNQEQDLQKFLGEKVNIEGVDQDYISSLLLPTLFQSIFYIGSSGTQIGRTAMSVESLYALINDVIFIKITVSKPSLRYSFVEYNLDTIVVTEDFAKEKLSVYQNRAETIAKVSKKYEKQKIADIANVENDLDISEIDALFVLAHKKAYAWRKAGENKIGLFQAPEDSFDAAEKYNQSKEHLSPSVDNKDNVTASDDQSLFESNLAMQLYFKLENSDPTHFETWYENVTNEELNTMLELAVHNQPGFFDEYTAKYRFVGRQVLSGEFTRHE